MQFKKSVVLILTAMFMLWGCNEEINTVNKVELSFGISKNTVSLSKTTGSGLDNVSKAIITLKEGGLLKYDQQEVSLVNWGNEGVYRTDLIEVDAGVSYNLTQFELRDENNVTLYATPLEGAPLAVNIDDPLPIAVNANKNEQKAIQVEVISTENFTPKDFGYPYFVVTDKTLLPFSVSVKAEGSLVDAKLTVNSGDYKFEKQLIAGKNDIVIKGAFDQYEVVVEKKGYKNYESTFTNAVLKNKHLLIDLIKKPLPANLVLVQGGTFSMGTNDAGAHQMHKPVHSVTLENFYISKYEVTNSEFAIFLNAMGNQSEGGVSWIELSNSYCRISENSGTFEVEAGYENYPVNCVTWYAAKAYCEWIGGRLPTEAEWEYAARGGNLSQGFVFSGSNNRDDVSLSKGAYGGGPVGSKTPNELGLYDMSGNFNEWCSDWFYDLYYPSSPVNNPLGPGNGSTKVFRGGEANSDDDFLKVWYRNAINPNVRSSGIGFRLVFPVY